MKSWIIGLLILICLIIAGGFIIGGNRASNGPGIETPKGNNESPNILPDPINTLTTPILSDEKVSAIALTCTIKNPMDYVIDLRLRNPGIGFRTITIDPSGTKMEMLPNRTYRVDLHLTKEVSMLNISVDDGTELHVQSPKCMTDGSSGSSSSGLVFQESTLFQENPPPPVPELSPLTLTLAGISGLMLLSRTRKK